MVGCFILQLLESKLSKIAYNYKITKVHFILHIVIGMILEHMKSRYQSQSKVLLVLLVKWWLNFLKPNLQWIAASPWSINFGTVTIGAPSRGQISNRLFHLQTPQKCIQYHRSRRRGNYNLRTTRDHHRMGLGPMGRMVRNDVTVGPKNMHDIL